MYEKKETKTFFLTSSHFPREYLDFKYGKIIVVVLWDQSRSPFLLNYYSPPKIKINNIKLDLIDKNVPTSNVVENQVLIKRAQSIEVSLGKSSSLKKIKITNIGSNLPLLHNMDFPTSKCCRESGSDWVSSIDRSTPRKTELTRKDQNQQHWFRSPSHLLHRFYFWHKRISCGPMKSIKIMQTDPKAKHVKTIKVKCFHHSPTTYLFLLYANIKETAWPQRD